MAKIAMASSPPMTFPITSLANGVHKQEFGPKHSAYFTALNKQESRLSQITQRVCRFQSTKLQHLPHPTMPLQGL